MTSRIVRELEEENARLRLENVLLLEGKLSASVREGLLVRRLGKYEDVTDIWHLIPWFERLNREEIFEAKDFCPTCGQAPPRERNTANE